MTDSSDIDLDQVLQLAMEAAHLAGAEIRRVTTDDADTRRLVDQKSSTTDLVTATDQHCEALVTDCIRQRFPQHAIIGEEASGADCEYTLTDAPTWTIDPIDGTTNFVHRLPITCVLISFLLKKQPVVGVVYDPSHDELFWAVQGRGAHLMRNASTVNSSGSSTSSHTDTANATASADLTARLVVSSTTTLTQAVVSMDAGYGRTTATVDRYLRVQRALLLQNIRHIRVLGSCGLTMAYVAAGRLDACLEQGSWQDNTGPKIWDLAAGKLMIQEAGGVTRDVTSKDTMDQPLSLLERSLFCAATPKLAHALLETIFSSEKEGAVNS